MKIQNTTDIDVYKIFKDFKDTLKNTSKDSTNNEFMTNNKKLIINFDKFVTKYTSNLNLNIRPNSNDAVIEDKDKNIVFIEFKNGQIKNRKNTR